MEKYLIKINMIIILNLLLLFKLSISLIIFPFEIAKEKSENINSDDINYNYKNFIKDYFTQMIYTNISIGSPSRKIKTLLTYDDNGFKIRNISECTNYDKNEETNIIAFSDTNLKRKENYENINFILFNSVYIYNINLKNYNDLICGIIGLKINKYKYNDIFGVKNDILENFYKKRYINESEWLLKYTSNERGLLIFGTDNLNDLIPNFNPDNLFRMKATISEGNYNWGFEIQKVICINKSKEENNITYIYNKGIIKSEINNDFSLIQGNYDYYNYIQKNFFKKYIEKKICSKNIFTKNEYSQYFVFECDKEGFNETDLLDFPLLCFYDFNDDIKFIFDYKDLFTESKYKFFFNIIFSVYNTDYWVFGKIFLKKYLIIINSEDKLIKVYLDKNKNNNTDNNIEIQKEAEKNDNNNKITFKHIILIGLFITFGFICFYFGRKLRRERKKKANELIDEYDYKPNHDDNKNENKIINYNNY